MLFSRKNESNKRGLRTAVYGLLTLILMIASFGAGLFFANKNTFVSSMAEQETALLGEVAGKYGPARYDSLKQSVDFNLFWEVWDMLKKDYVNRDKLNEKEMFYGAIRGLVASVGDPYTIFMNPKEAKQFDEDLAGTFEGIGAEIGIKKENLVIVAPLPESPAEKAGLRAGDWINKINGESTAGLSVDQAVGKIRGPKGTIVTLNIVRGDLPDGKDFKIARDVIVVKSVVTKMREDGIYILTISSFNDDTEQLFNKAVADIVEKNPKGLIVDLRNNPGGYLDTAVEVASEWIDGGVIVTEKFSDQKKNEYLTRGLHRLKDIPTIALINQGSASASEIVAGALQDTLKAKLVGKQSFGKGSVQTLETLPDGSSLKVTVAQWLTPKGINISEQGIKPDVEVDLTPKDYEESKDPQMDKAIELLSAKPR